MTHMQLLNGYMYALRLICHVTNAESIIPNFFALSSNRLIQRFPGIAACVKLIFPYESAPQRPKRVHGPLKL